MDERQTETAAAGSVAEIFAVFLRLGLRSGGLVRIPLPSVFAMVPFAYGANMVAGGFAGRLARRGRGVHEAPCACRDFFLA